jgi:hypothetical protein
LPFTLPRHVGQVPVHHGQHWGSGYRRTEAAIHHGYLDMPSTPLFPFGHGLSYTTFEYSPLELEKDTVDVGGRRRTQVPLRRDGRLAIEVTVSADGCEEAAVTIDAGAVAAEAHKARLVVR